MGWWNDPEWPAAVRGEACRICREWPSPDTLATLEATWVAMGEDAPMRGYAFLVFRPRHVVELHELDDAEGAALMRDLRRVSRAVAAATGAVKLNYEIHGNTAPHLHVHVFPRYPGDPFEGRPIDPKSVRGPVYAAGEYERLRERVRLALGD
jgi:diadenosine tetraphosphate (Ap4A) HIT family hydrolase